LKIGTAELRSSLGSGHLGTPSKLYKTGSWKPKWNESMWS